jgi:hypothetical protein
MWGYNNIMRQTVVTLLVVIVFGCPILCGRQHEPLVSANPATSHTCSCCGNAADGDGAPSRQRFPDPTSGCQCICGGALTSHTTDYDLSFDWSWSLPLTMIEPVASQLLEESPPSSVASPWPDVGMNYGRALCYLFSTMQC